MTRGTSETLDSTSERGAVLDFDFSLCFMRGVFAPRCRGVGIGRRVVRAPLVGGDNIFVISAAVRGGFCTVDAEE